MSKIKFELAEKSRANSIWIKLEYMSGDADAYRYEECDLGILYSEWEQHLDKINKEIENYTLITKFTDCNNELCLKDKRWGLKIGQREAYNYIKQNYSEELADLFDNVPGDSTCQGEFKAYLSNITLIGYDEQGNKYESYV